MKQMRDAKENCWQIASSEGTLFAGFARNNLEVPGFYSWLLYLSYWYYYLIGTKLVIYVIPILGFAHHVIGS